jgi:hypothetical protein
LMNDQVVESRNFATDVEKDEIIFEYLDRFLPGLLFKYE